MPDSRVDTIIDRLRNARSTGIDHRGEVRVPLAVAVAAVHAAAGLGSPDERLREAGERLAQTVAQVCGEGHPALGVWRVALAAADREAPDEPGRICCRGMGADGGCNICAAEATR